MSSILLITSSPRGEQSHSTRIAAELAEKLASRRAGVTLVRRDLAADPLPHIGTDFAAGISTAPEQRTPAQARAIAVSDELVDELFAADTVIIASGMINFGIPSVLKAWIDNIARSGRTFRYTDEGPEGLLKGKKAYLVVASGGVYSEGPAAALNHAAPYLRSTLNFLGITDIEEIAIEGVAMGPEIERQALTRAVDRTEQLAAAA